MKYDEKGGLAYAAYEATNAVCNYGFGRFLIIAVWAMYIQIFSKNFMGPKFQSSINK